MEMMTIDDLAAIMMREFGRVQGRFDRLEKRVMHVEETVEEHSGKFIRIDDRLSHIEYALDEANPRELKKRLELLEKHVFRPA